MSELNEKDTVDAETVFDVDFTSNPVSADKSKKEKPKQATQENPFEGVEETLGLRISTSKRTIRVERVTHDDEEALDLLDFPMVAVVKSQTFTSDGVHFETTAS